MPVRHYVIELNGQSHETDRDDLTNEDVITCPVVDGPFDSFEEAKAAANKPRAEYSDGYAAVSVMEDDDE